MMTGRPAKKNKGRGPFARFRQRIAKVMSSKGFLLVVSLLTAVLFWGVLMASDSTLTMQKTFQGVEVAVTGASSLQSRGYVVIDDITKLVPSVRMTVEVTQANYDRVSGAAYNPHFDLSQITGEGTATLDIVYSSQAYGPVISCEPSSVTVNVERYMTRRVPVVLQTTGEAPEGIYLDTTRTDPTMLSVSGPQSLVSTIARAVVRLDLSLLSLERISDKMSLPFELQMVSGEPVDDDLLEITNQTVITSSVVVETEILPQRTLPLSLEMAVTGEPAEGYALVGITASQDHFSIAASQETLDAISELTVDQPLNLTGATADVTGYVRLRRPSGLRSTLPTEVSITAHIEEIQDVRTFRDLPVAVDGLDENLYQASLSSGSVTAQITGPYHFMQTLQAEDIRLYVDASDHGAGSYNLPVQVHIDHADESIGDLLSCALSQTALTVVIAPRP